MTSGSDPRPRPDWLASLAALVGNVRAEELSRFLPPANGGRQSAVLILFGEGEDGPEVVLIERGHTLRDHPGQPALPGGAVDPGDDGPVGTALREAAEEIGLDAASVEVLGALPSIFLPPSGYVVTPVLAWESHRHELRPLDLIEVAAVHRVPMSELLDPANRGIADHPNGSSGPAFDFRGLLVWGFTAGLLDRLFRLAGWEQPWDSGRTWGAPPLPAPGEGGSPMTPPGSTR